MLTWTDASKTVKISLSTKDIELKQTRSPFARLLITARTREGLDLQDRIGLYEFSCVPRSLFASDRSLLPCTDKSKLVALLESLGTDETERAEDMEQDLPSGDSQIENRDDPNPRLQMIHSRRHWKPMRKARTRREQEIVRKARRAHVASMGMM